MSIDLNYSELFERVRGTTRDSTKVMHHVCIACGREPDTPSTNRCASCGGPTDVIYDLDAVKLPPWRATPNTLEHYFPLVPLARRSALVWMGDGNTPCHEAPEVARRLGVRKVFVKDESANPTRSTKDRVASVAISRFLELGIHEVVLASTGNSSTAFARGAQLVEDFKAHIFVGRNFLDRLNYPDHPNVVTHVVDGDFVDAGAVAQKFAAEHGLFWEGGFFNLARREGLKLAYLEAYDSMPEPPDYVFQAVSSGMGLIGGYKGALEYVHLGRLPKMPAFIGVQQESCAPMAAAFAEDTETIADHHIVRDPRGLAYAILRGNPTQTYPYMRAMVKSSRGAIVAAPERTIHQARGLLEGSLALNVCYASSTALAGLIHAVRQGMIPSDAVVLVNLTGTDRPRAPIPEKLVTWQAGQLVGAAS